MIEIMAIAFAVIIIATFIFAVIRHARLDAGEILLIRETILTVVLGFALWIEAGVLLYCRMTLFTQYNISQNASFNLLVFMIVSILLGAAIILYGAIKCTGVSAKGIRFTNILGVSESINWNDIINAKQAAGKRILFTASDGKTYSVGGNRADFKRFVRLGCENIKNREVLSVLIKLKKSLKM